MAGNSRSPATNSSESGELDRHLSPGRFAMLVGALIFLMFPWLILGRETMIMRDFGFFSYPLAFYHRESFWRGEIPLWNPLSDCGIPFLAQWNTMVCYPPSLFYLLLPIPWALNVFLMLHWFLGAMGAYKLAHQWTGDRLGASVAGTVFAFNGLAINCLIWPNVTAALGWMPWVVLATWKARILGNRHIIFAAILGALQMLTGAVELILLTWLIVALLIVVAGRSDSVPRLTQGIRTALVVILITGLCSLQLLPFFELLLHSNRDSSFLEKASAVPVSGWANFLVPLFRLSRSPVGIYYQPEQFWTMSYYLSLIALALALFTVWRPRLTFTSWLALACGASVIVAMGDHTFVYQSLRKALPVVNLINFPAKYLLVLPLLTSLLAAFGVRRFRREADAHESTVRFRWVVTALVALVVGVLVYGRFSANTRDWSSMILWNGIERVAFLLAAFGLIRLCLRPIPQNTMVGVFVALALPVLIWLDVVTHTPHQNPTVKSVALEPGFRNLTNAVSMSSQPPGRILLSHEARVRTDRVTLADPLNDYLGHRLSEAFNCNLLDGLPKVEGFYPLFLKEHIDILRLLYTHPDATSSRLADFLSVSHVSESGNPLELASRDSFAPIVTTGQLPVFADRTETLRGLVSPEFDPAMIVYLPLEARGLIDDKNRGDAVLRSSRIGTQTAVIELESSRSNLVVVAQSFYHPWQAEINGAPARIWRANEAFQAIVVPAGRIKLTLKYEDRAFMAGLAVSILALMIAWHTRVDKPSSTTRQFS